MLLKYFIHLKHMLSEKSKLNQKTSINAIASRSIIGNQLNRFGPPTQFIRHSKINWTASLAHCPFVFSGYYFPFLSNSRSKRRSIGKRDEFRLTTSFSTGVLLLIRSQLLLLLLLLRSLTTSTWRRHPQSRKRIRPFHQVFFYPFFKYKYSTTIFTFAVHARILYFP